MSCRSIPVGCRLRHLALPAYPAAERSRGYSNCSQRRQKFSAQVLERGAVSPLPRVDRLRVLQIGLEAVGEARAGSLPNTTASTLVVEEHAAVIEVRRPDDGPDLVDDPWSWSANPVVTLVDLHAGAEQFFRSESVVPLAPVPNRCAMAAAAEHLRHGGLRR